jgi:hypothetical protein
MIAQTKTTNISSGAVCDVSYCGEHLVERCIDKDSDDLCSDCEARALSNPDGLAGFGQWVQELEDKYSVKVAIAGPVQARIFRKV